MRTHPISSRSGFTMIEMAIVAVLLSIALGSVALFQLSNGRTLQQSSAVNVAQERAHQAIERVLRELDGAAISTLVPDPTGALGADELVFQKSLGVDGTGSVLWSSRTRLALELDDHETLNGLDDDADGLVDERKLTLTTDWGTPAARTQVIAHRLPALFPGEAANGIDDDGNGVIDEKGFNVHRVGNLLDLRLAIQARGPDGKWVTWRESSSTRLRN